MTIPLVGGVPAISADQMRRVDEIMIDQLGIDLPRMMENAGLQLAALARRRYRFDTVAILAGSGGNGGGGLVAARHLANRGVTVTVTTGRPLGGMTEVPRRQYDILERMGVRITDEPEAADLVIDALIGYSLTGDPRGRAADLIAWANGQPAPVLALDVPSGLDATTGRVGDPCVVADATLTLALPKTGLEAAPHIVGALYLADISVPRSVYREMGVDLVDPFSAGPIVRLR